VVGVLTISCGGATGARCGYAPDVDATTETSTTIGTSTKDNLQQSSAHWQQVLVLWYYREREIVFRKPVTIANIGKSGIQERVKSIG
jgi:hypothetical protein